MAPDSQQLAADLSQLKSIADIDLAMLRYIYAKFSTIMNDESVGGAFVPPDKVGYDSVQTPWHTTYNVLQDNLAYTATSLEAAAVGLNHVIAVYSSVDTTAAQGLSSLWAGGQPAADHWGSEVGVTPSEPTYSGRGED